MGYRKVKHNHKQRETFCDKCGYVAKIGESMIVLGYEPDRHKCLHCSREEKVKFKLSSYPPEVRELVRIVKEYTDEGDPETEYDGQMMSACCNGDHVGDHSDDCLWMSLVRQIELFGDKRK